MATVNTAYPSDGMERRVGDSTNDTINGHVGFREPSNSSQYSNEREKYLTAKYPKRQMSLIRKRIAVEHWLDCELKLLYGVGEDDLYDCEIDLDELLDYDQEEERIAAIREKVSNCKQTPDVIQKFITALLEKAKTL